MSVEDRVAGHYGTGGLMQRIRQGLQAAGADPDAPDAEALSPVDEFHIGGVAATRDVVGQMSIGPGMTVLDIGSGIGGTARYVARATGATVTGIDLTPEFVETAGTLSAMTGLSDRTRFTVGSATALPFEDATFDRAMLMHVGMNIPDKSRLIAETARVLKPGGIFAIYDVMALNESPIAFPVPWSSGPEGSFLASLADYRAAARAAGLEETASRGRRDFALDFFAKMRAAMSGTDRPPPLGLHLLMGADAGVKIANMIENLKAGRYEPTELILAKPG